jgi:hypothetical protein
MHARLLPALVVIVIIIVAIVVAFGTRSGPGFERIVRCRSGHLFSTTLVPGMSFKAVRLWNVRFERCPIGHHWTLVRPVDESTLSSDELAAARAHHDIRIP